MPKVERKVIEEKLSKEFQSFGAVKTLAPKLRKEFTQFGISPADIQEIFSGKKELNDVSLEVLCLITTKLYDLTKGKSIKPDELFTTQEIKQSMTIEIENNDRIILPYTFHNVTYIKDGNYSTVITAQEIKKLWYSNLLIYNFETQREARFERNKDDEIVPRAKTIEKSVNEISNLIKSDDLEITTLTFNARVNTADSGEEVIYDHKNRTLTITKGTQLDILDGYHRISGVLRALTDDDSLDATFDLKILNYRTSRALKYFNQINKTNPVSESRLKETNVGNMSTVAAEELKDKCDYLMGKVSSGDRLFTNADQLVSSKVLIDAIDEHFNPSDRLEAKEVGTYLAKFFTELFEQHPEGLIRNINEVRKHSLINANYMFDGYIFLAKLMKDKNISLNKLSDIIGKIDFDRNNPLWVQMGILDENKSITANPKRKIRQVFSNLELGEVLTSV